MRTLAIYNHEKQRRDQKFQNVIRNTPRMTAAQLFEESDKLMSEKIKRKEAEKRRKRLLRERAEAEKAAMV